MPTNTPNNYGQGRSEHQKDQKDAKEAFQTQKDKEAMSTSTSERERTEQGKGGGARSERERDREPGGKDMREAGGKDMAGKDMAGKDMGGKKEPGASDREAAGESEGGESFVARAKEKVGQLGAQAGERASDIGKYAYFNLGKFVQERPVVALGISFLAGAFVSHRLFRKS